VATALLNGLTPWSRRLAGYFGALRLPAFTWWLRFASSAFNEFEAVERPQITNAFAGANKRIGRPGFEGHRRATPPRALPSTLVTPPPVRPAALAKAIAWRKPFLDPGWHQATNSGFHAAEGAKRSMMRALASSSSKCAGLQPAAVSTSNQFGAPWPGRPRFASNTTAAGSALPLGVGDHRHAAALSPDRDLLATAARAESVGAAIQTSCTAAHRRWPSLPRVVVLRPRSRPPKADMS